MKFFYNSIYQSENEAKQWRQRPRVKKGTGAQPPAIRNTAGAFREQKINFIITGSL